MSPGMCACRDTDPACPRVLGAPRERVCIFSVPGAVVMISPGVGDFQKCFWAVLNPVRARTVRRFQGSRTGWIPRSPWYLAYVPSPTNLKMCDRTKPNLDSTHDRTKPNLDSTHELRGCARTVRSSSKASNPTFQPLIGSQAPTPEVLVPVINLVCFSVPNPLCCIDSGGRAGLLTKPYKIEQVQIL